MKNDSDDLPRGDELAQVFGLEDLRIGRHRHVDLWLKYFWTIEIVPSFHHRSILCGIRCVQDGEPGQSNSKTGWLKIAYACPSASFVMDVKEDPVSSVLRTFDLLPDEFSIVIDGMGFDVVFETYELRGRFAFYNPTSESLQKLAWAVVSTAKQVADSSMIRELKESIDTWTDYGYSR